MQFSQEEVERAVGGGGVVAADLAAHIRATRVAEQWERYDSVVIGPTAKAFDEGWFNTWAEFAAADEIVWFQKRSSNVGRAYSNQQTERTDWAQDFYQTGIEFYAPPGLGERERDILDQVIMPIFFTRELPNRMSFRIALADADTIAEFPGIHCPSGYGTTGVEASQAPAPLMIPGQTGDAHVSNTWKWPEPVMLPAQGRIAVRGRIDQPIKAYLAQLTTCPGFKSLPLCGPAQPPTGPVSLASYPNWYVIRVFHRGPRYLQLRGARSAA